MRYLPKSPADREAMLAEIGAATIESLFETIPAEYRLTEDLKIPRQHSESEILERFRAFGANVASAMRRSWLRRRRGDCLRAFWVRGLIGIIGR